MFKQTPCCQLKIAETENIWHLGVCCWVYPYWVFMKTLMYIKYEMFCDREASREGKFVVFATSVWVRHEGNDYGVLWWCGYWAALMKSRQIAEEEQKSCRMWLITVGRSVRTYFSLSLSSLHSNTSVIATLLQHNCSFNGGNLHS